MMNARPNLIVSIAVLMAGCQAAPPPLPSRDVVTNLYFGLGMKDGSTVPDEAWQKFVETEVTPRFPAGFTIDTVEGAWGQDGKTVRESSRVLTIVHKEGTADEDKIETLRWLYRQQFQQDAVMRVDDVVDRVSF